MRIVVAMSGGVDSSVAAALLAEQGHEVIGLSMQLYDQSEGQTSFGSCCSIDDLHDARRVAAAIDIPHYIMNFERQFNQQVVANFVAERLATIEGVKGTQTNFLLKKYKEDGVLFTGGDNNHGDIAHRPEHGEHLDAVDVRKPKIEQNYVGSIVDHGLQSW